MSTPRPPADYFGDLVHDLAGLGAEYIASGGLTVSVKTNLGPEIPVSTAGGGGIAGALGIEAAVIVRNKSGNILQTVGTPPPTDYVKAAVLVVAALGLVFVLARGLRVK